MNKPYLNTTWVIAKSTYKEIIRDRLLYGILVIALLVTTSSFFMATISLEQNARVLQNIGLASIHVFTLFICVFVATTSMGKDVDRRTLYLLFSKPISRDQYILGKYTGLVMLLLTSLALLGGFFSLGALAIGQANFPVILINLGFSVLEISLLLSIAVLFAAFAAPLNATLYTLAIFIIGHSLLALKEFVSANSGAFAQGLVKTAYYLLPNLDKFDVRRPLLYQLHIPAESIIWSLVYWLFYTALALYLATQVMKKREV